VHTNDVAFVVRNREALAEVNPVPVLDGKLLEQLVHKLNFVRLAASLGLSTPKTFEMTPELDAGDTIAHLGLPMLAKPVIGEGGAGIVAIPDAVPLRDLLDRPATGSGMILQQQVPGEDVALTLLAEMGEVFAVMIRKRWFTRRHIPAFSPISDVEYLQDDWLEGLGREFVCATQFSGIADFDLRVDFETRRAWFLESDPRLMASMSSARLFGVNVPWLLVEHTRGWLPAGVCVRPEAGHFLSTGSIAGWIASGAWRQPLRGPLRTNLRSYIANPVATVNRMLGFQES
jgi:predicted ATP-grasp superfamily ATP-dependent carboligase